VAPQRGQPAFDPPLAGPSSETVRASCGTGPVKAEACVVSSRHRPAPPELAPSSFVESLIDTLVAGLPGDVVSEAREAFEAQGGAFSTADPFHEERMRAFSEVLVCARRLEDGRTPAERALAGSPEGDASETGSWLLALVRSERGLFRAELGSERPTLRCLLGGVSYAVRFDADPREAAARLREGDVFDGRIAPWRGELRVLPGMVFHPEEAHDALFALVREAIARRIPRAEILDGLLRMRMRHDRFTSIHARHLYRLEALGKLEIQAASWKGAGPPRSR
jgi:hypothetical protein